MDHFENIYANKAFEYHRMIEVEDVDQNLLPALQEITSLKNKTIIDLGSGTGRIPLLLSKIQKEIHALDLNRPMLLEQKRQRDMQAETWSLVEGDMRKIPYATNAADIVIAGWAIGHLRGWFENDWVDQISSILDEMKRIAKPGGIVIVMETMTTGSLTPAPPTPGLAEYYTLMENDHNFKTKTIQTDYQFRDLEESVAFTEFFFGEELSQNIRENNWVRLPEWTGMWWKTV
ncbi:MAG: class I SAM-dependent methyltransferase [Anaerolineaceae bacterium]|nr:class I SAM-dependent methyltransferase [Anaerolineaceae bacterium]